MKALITIALLSFCIACHAKFTAALSGNVVVDTEQWDEANPPAPRADGLQRVDCPEWVDQVGRGVQFVGGAWLMPDGSPPPNWLLDRVENEKAKDFRRKLKSMSSDADLLKSGSGTNAQRIARLEEFVHLYYRILLWAVRIII